MTPNPNVEHYAHYRFDGRYRAVCSCNWIGQERDTRTEAQADGDEHVTAAKP